MRRFWGVLGLGLGVVGLTACGATHGLTKTQYGAKVSRLCLLASDQVRELHMDNSIAAWRSDAARLIHVEQRFDHALAALKAPNGIASAATTYLKENERVLADEKAAAAAARAGDRASLRADVDQAGRDGLASWPSAKAIGAKGCYIA